MPIPAMLDHCVNHVSQWERSNEFYARMLGAELAARVGAKLGTAP